MKPYEWTDESKILLLKAKKRAGTFKAVSKETGINMHALMRLKSKVGGWITDKSYARLRKLPEFNGQGTGTEIPNIPEGFGVSKSRLFMLTALDGLPENERQKIEKKATEMALLRQAELKPKKSDAKVRNI